MRWQEHVRRLGEALVLQDERVIAFTGGGGKTSAMFRLAAEHAVERVLVTTTTRIWLPRADQAELYVVETLPEAMRRLQADWHGGVRALGTAVTSEGKLQGIPPNWVADLAAVADRVLVEADGAAGKPITVPRDYEPVIPPTTELLVPVCGLDAVGAPLDAEHVHRAPEMAARLYRTPGDRLTVRDVADVMLSRWGNVKGAPMHARIVPLVNKVDAIEPLLRAGWKAGRDPAWSDDQQAAYNTAGTLAHALLARGVSLVVLATLAARPPRLMIVAARAD